MAWQSKCSENVIQAHASSRDIFHEQSGVEGSAEGDGEEILQ